MATTQDYMEYVRERLPECGDVRYRKMFGEYMVYVNDKPLLTVCDNTVFVKRYRSWQSLWRAPVSAAPMRARRSTTSWTSTTRT